MNASAPIELVATAFESHTARISLDFGESEGGKLDARVSIRLIECHFEITTCFFGYNLDWFTREAQSAIASEQGLAKLLNYDQSLTLEFQRLRGGREFLTFDYKSSVPDRPEEDVFSQLTKQSSMDAGKTWGSRFTAFYLPLHTPISGFIDAIGDVISSRGVDTKNPYPIS